MKNQTCKDFHSIDLQQEEIKKVNPSYKKSLGTMSKNKLRGIPLGIKPIWGIHSLALIFSCLQSINVVLSFESVNETLICER